MINDKIHRYILDNREVILKDYIDILKIPSISDTQATIDIMYFIKNLYEKNGFEAEVYEDYLLSHYKKGNHTIGLFAHADVVPVDDKWTVTEPFEPKIINGELFARGSGDDKSAIIISLYALKAIKELNIPFKSSLLCFTGINEESTMQDIKNYVKSHILPDFSLVLDAGFPVYYGDKGMLWLLLTLNEAPFEHLIDINGGNAYNIIVGEAKARVKYISSLYNELSNNESITVEKQENEILIYAKGISAHGATPRGSINAGGIILKALFDSQSFSKNDKEKLSLALKLLTTYDGEALNIKSTDSIYGDTTVTNGIVKIEDGNLKLSLDIRYGNTFTEQKLISHLHNILSKENITFEIAKNGEPRNIDLNSSYIKACIKAYKDHTGDENAKPYINAGSTYLRYLPSSAETGTNTKYNCYCGLPNGHGGAHQPNEHINVDGFFEALEIIIKMLIEIDKVD